MEAESSHHAAVRQRSIAQELNSVLLRETAKSRLRRLASYASTPSKRFNPICPNTTLAACRELRPACPKAHYEPIIRPWTDPSLGYCSYLNLCYGDPMFARNPSLGEGQGPGPRGGTKECRYLHFQVTPAEQPHAEPVPQLPIYLSQGMQDRLLFAGAKEGTGEPGGSETAGTSGKGKSKQAEWINCDIRSFDYSVLGQFQVIVADPPWDIHMALPYGTMTDDEMRRLPLPSLQPDWGILCLWVTGRAMELARELFALWGYRRVDELVWVKTNQLQRLIRTGRTGHWLNHTCEHLLVAVKMPAAFPRTAPIPWDADPGLRALRRGVDTDVVVAEVRETSRKPDEVYGVIERLVPDGRKLEMFGRKHNVRPGWLTLGNQLGDSRVADAALHDRLRTRYPQQDVRLVQNA